MTVFKCLYGLASKYLADDCLTISAIAGKRHLRSTVCTKDKDHAQDEDGPLFVPRTRTTLRTRSFIVARQSSGTVYKPLCELLLSLSATFARHLEGPPVWLIDSASEDHL